jgi:hypothetical protein
VPNIKVLAAHDMTLLSLAEHYEASPGPVRGRNTTYGKMNNSTNLKNRLNWVDLKFSKK